MSLRHFVVDSEEALCFEAYYNGIHKIHEERVFSNEAEEDMLVASHGIHRVALG